MCEIPPNGDGLFKIGEAGLPEEVGNLEGVNWELYSCAVLSISYLKEDLGGEKVVEFGEKLEDAASCWELAGSRLIFQFTTGLLSTGPALLDLDCHCEKRGECSLPRGGSSLLISWVTLMAALGAGGAGEGVGRELLVAVVGGLESGALKLGSVLSGGREGVSFVFGLVLLTGVAVREGMGGSGVEIGVVWERGERAVRGGSVESPKVSSPEFGKLLRSKKYKNKSVSSFLIIPFLDLSGSSPPSSLPEVESVDVEVVVVEVVLGGFSLKSLNCEVVAVRGGDGSLSSLLSCTANQIK